jgi:hypothetical protein
LNIAREMGNKSLIAYALYLLGEVYAHQGNLAAARKSDEQALQIRNELASRAPLAKPNCLSRTCRSRKNSTLMPNRLPAMPLLSSKN